MGYDVSATPFGLALTISRDDRLAGLGFLDPFAQIRIGEIRPNPGLRSGGIPGRHAFPSYFFGT